MLTGTRPSRGAGRPTKEEEQKKLLYRKRQELPKLFTEIKIFAEIRGNEKPTVYVGQLIEDLGNMYLFVSSTPGQYRQCFLKIDFETGILKYTYLEKLAN